MKPEVAKILVVDDQTALRELLVEVFQSLGHDAEGTGSGREALERCQQQHFDLITLDVNLPDVSGPEIWKAIAARDRALAGRVVFVTGGTTSADVQAFLETTGCVVLEKPLTIDRISRIASEVLGGVPAGMVERGR
jgi:CheY-like chemotaxis protein